MLLLLLALRGVGHDHGDDALEQRALEVRIIGVFGLLHHDSGLFKDRVGLFVDGTLEPEFFLERHEKPI